MNNSHSTAGGGMNPSDQMPIIRPAVPADAPALAECQHACWREAYHGQLSAGFLAALDDDARAAWWRHNLVEPSEERIFIAEMGREILGFAGAGQSFDDPPLRDLQLHMLYVRQSTYGNGLGQGLFDAAVGDRPCSLWVARDNSRAIRFYQRQGFLADGTSEAVPEFEDLVTIRMLR